MNWQTRLPDDILEAELAIGDLNCMFHEMTLLDVAHAVASGYGLQSWHCAAEL